MSFISRETSPAEVTLSSTHITHFQAFLKIIFNSLKLTKLNHDLLSRDEEELEIVISLHSWELTLPAQHKRWKTASSFVVFDKDVYILPWSKFKLNRCNVTNVKYVYYTYNYK